MMCNQIFESIEDVNEQSRESQTNEKIKKRKSDLKSEVFSENDNLNQPKYKQLGEPRVKSNGKQRRNEKAVIHPLPSMSSRTSTNP